MNRLADYLSLHLLRKIGIRYRLIGSCVLLSLLPLAFSGFISYAGSSAAIAERTRVLSTEVVKQVAKNIQFEMARLESDSEALVLSDRVQDALAHYAGGDEMHMTAARRELMRALLERYGSFDFINQKYILDRDNRIIDAQVFSTLGRGVVQFVERAPKLPGRSHWGTYDNAAGQKSMVLLRPIHNKANHQLVGNLFLGVRPSHFWSIFEDVNLGSGTDMFVLDADAGKVVVKNQQRPAAGPDSRPDAALTNELRRSIQRNERSGFAGYSGRQAGEQRAAYAQIADTSWFVVSTVPLGQLTIEAQSVRDKSILVGLSGLVLSIALALILARSISAPLERLAHGMRETEAGNYAGRMAPEGQDELTVLARQFNQMAGKVGQRHVQSEERMMERTRDLAEANGKLAALNMTDGLTGIANRRRFDELLALELQRAASAGTPLALLMLDIDFFKNYNDFYGHQEGDACLRRVAGLLQSHARRAGDLSARHGGEQFIMIAADTDADSALALAEAIRCSFEALRLAHERSPLGCVTASIGVASIVPDESSSAEKLLRMADQAMHRAKEQGRNQVAMARSKVPA
jgi:diguanylate cyclase (GGDEF)-like protein